MATAAIELTAVRKVYSARSPVDALHGVDIEVAAGEFVSIVGPSGCGKSTLLHLIGTLDRPTSGAIMVLGQAVATLSDGGLARLRSRAIGFVFQQHHLIDGLNALDNVAQPLVYQGVPRRQRRDRAAETLHRLGLGGRLDHLPSALSGGESQRVAIARAVVTDPAIVLADEPTGNLDSATGHAVMDLLVSIHREGRTVVVVTHDRELAGIAPRTVRMVDGRVVEPPGRP